MVIQKLKNKFYEKYVTREDYEALSEAWECTLNQTTQHWTEKFDKKQERVIDLVKELESCDNKLAIGGIFLALSVFLNIFLLISLYIE